MSDGALGGMMGLIPLTIGAGLVMKITDRMMPPDRGRGGSRYGSMEGEQERYEEKKPMKKMHYGSGYGNMGSGGMGSGYGNMGSGGMKKQMGTYGKYAMGMGKGKSNGKPKRTRRSGGATNPSGLTSMMKKEGSKVRQSVAYEGHKFGQGTLGSLPGVGKVTVGKISDIGIGGNRMFDIAKKSMRARTLGRL